VLNNMSDGVYLSWMSNDIHSATLKDITLNLDWYISPSVNWKVAVGCMRNFGSGYSTLCNIVYLPGVTMTGWTGNNLCDQIPDGIPYNKTVTSQYTWTSTINVCSTNYLNYRYAHKANNSYDSNIPLYQHQLAKLSLVKANQTTNKYELLNAPYSTINYFSVPWKITWLENYVNSLEDLVSN